MIGKTIAHYEILEQIGKGGMGEVYRARDTRLARDVALKILPAAHSEDDDRRKRFTREAQAIAALKHPNIVTIHSVEEADGLQFITMEYIEGETLGRRIPEGGMDLDTFFATAVPLADAISSAHEQGITHRDLKPGNIMFDRDGRLKVLDFGLAKLLLTETEDDGATLAMGSDTAAGQIMGTAAYMSPEQAEGKPIDHRSDIFSLGIVLYEMATGTRPFQGDTQISTISAILKDTPQLVSDMRRQLPRHLGRIVSRCLEKDPEERYQSAKDVRNEVAGLKREVDTDQLTGQVERMPVLKQTGSDRRRRFLGIGGVVSLGIVLLVWAWGRDSNTPEEQATLQALQTEAAPPASVFPQDRVEERKMVVVLPFENLGQPEDAYFAAGMTDEITTRILSVDDLGVISRRSATQYDRTGKTMRQIGAELGVDYVLEGTVRWAKGAEGVDRVRITPQLVRVSDDSQIWSQAYDRHIDDVFEVQSEIAQQMMQQLGVTLTQSELQHLEASPTENVEAYKLYLRAYSLYDSDMLSTEDEVLSLLDEALSIDPEFVRGWAFLAQYHFAWYTNWDVSDKRLAAGRRALRQAESLDPEHVETRVARGSYQYYGFRNYPQALAEFEAVAQIAPSHALARLQIGNIQRRMGDMDRAIENQKMSVLLDPQSTNNLLQLGRSYAGTRQFEKAIECFRGVIAAGDGSAGWAAENMAIAQLSWNGDMSLIVNPPVPSEFLPFRHLYYKADWEGLIEAMQEMPDDPVLEQRGFQALMRMFHGTAIFYAHGPEAAKPVLQDAVVALEAALDEAPEDDQIRAWYATALAYLGEERAALREGRQAVEHSRPDLFFGVPVQESLVEVYAVLGYQEEAIDLLEQLLQSDYEEALTVHRLRVMSSWKHFLKDHPRFQALIAEKS